MSLEPRIVELLAIVAVAVALVAAGFAIIAHTKVRGVTRAWQRAAAAGVSLETAAGLSKNSALVEELRTEVASLRSEAEANRADVRDAIRHLAVVRYDAFGDMGGRLSFSAALLDDSGAGLVITSINGRSETRTYAKGISAGGSEQPLSPEEKQAIAFAKRGARSPAA